MGMISIYQISDGRVLYSEEIGEDETPELEAGEAWLDGEYDGALYYVVDGAATDRPQLVDDDRDYTLDADGVTVLTIPLVDGTTVYYGDTESVSSGTESLQVRSAIAGDFTFQILPPWPYVEAEIVVTSDVV
ncbi:hypothetical protein M2360_000935 [Rhizobium sp. SG_E_25_P2]|uniref:hypothetical protein n=1 Tax=Rhizobium sp. SG_E_25_P2 TaxID=2879942 RepID=UPI002476015C|nr:hypothetical protein [Rhizobium sp. SG_E_25_P2]MDH6265545.1 hypothetical protein [Rhizobium sp. SG_E_25_P2]